MGTSAKWMTFFVVTSTPPASRLARSIGHTASGGVVDSSSSAVPIRLFAIACRPHRRCDRISRFANW
jgi:hypothetical protein